MQASLRPYDHAADYDRIGRFLVSTYRTSGAHVNWLQPRWEYMHHHPYIRGVDLRSIGVWEAGGTVVGVVHPELAMGTAYFEIDPEHGSPREEMLAHAEERVSTLREATRRLRLYIGDGDEAFQKLASQAGYERGGGTEPMSHLPLTETLPEAPLPPGFRLKSLDDDNDLRKVDRVLWRGFDHGDEPPEGGIADRELMQSAPNFRKELNLVVEAPGGEFVSYCGMWYEPVHSVAYVEPVATDPDYRRMGLAQAAITEGLRRCAALGATVAYVGATLPLYLALGFRKTYGSSAWQREWT